MFPAILFFLALYITFLLMVLVGLLRALQQDSTAPVSHPQHYMTVVVAFRDEGANLPALIRCLQRQAYPTFEVVLVDDHSTDRGAEMAASIVNGDPRFTVMKSSGEGKKEAITTGVSVAKGEVIVTTDADCVLHENWLQEINHAFASPEVKLTMGPVSVQGESSFFARLQEAEFSTVMATGMAASAFGFPLYANGANLAYRKDAFTSLAGFEGNLHISSGDDEFMLRKISNAFPGSLRFVGNIHSIVSTKPQASLSDFFQQRLRWAAKWREAPIISKLIAVTVWLTQVAVVTGWIVFLAGGSYATGYALALKGILELAIIQVMLRRGGRRVSLRVFLVLQFFYPVYVIVVGIASNFLMFRWKGRRYVH